MKNSKNLKFYFFLVIGLTSAPLFLISSAAHLATFWNINVEEKIPFIYLLHFGLFVFGVPFILYIKLFDGKEEKTPPKTESNIAGSVRETISERLGFPIWVIPICFIIGLYAMFNFLIFFVHSLNNPATPEIRNGTYVLYSEGEYKEISKNEYDIASTKKLRVFSGAWMVSYLVLSSFVLFEARNIKKEKGRKMVKSENPNDQNKTV